ncbi:MAG: DUF6010 family protein [Candidatus Electrothrix scaldis]|nr:MAG: DUF6010 family protein [Candidatus Electrothrix sp. GW3-3]
MEAVSTAIGYIIIAVFYAIFGVTVGLGSIYLTKAFSNLKMEQVFFGVLLVLIAAFYWAFTLYFGAQDAWTIEIVSVLGFAVLGLAGIRFTTLLIIGYLLHGIWDGVHEFNMSRVRLF